MAEITHFNRYNNSKIYKICSNLTNKIYIGSTTQSIQQRLSEHAGNYKHYLKTNTHYISSYEIIKLGDAFIVLLEQCNFNNKQQLERREGEIMKLNINNIINKHIAGRTLEEYLNDNKEILENRRKEYNKEYIIINAEHIKEKHKEYHINNAEHVSQNKKEYYNNNKEIIAEKIKQYITNNAEKRKEYQTKNAEIIKEKRKQSYNLNKKPILCECGLTIQTNIHIHKKTNKHLTLIYYNELNFYNL
jgi:hypothetical protein